MEIIILLSLLISGPINSGPINYWLTNYCCPVVVNYYKIV